MRLLQWERFVPDADGNRARHARGEPALVLEVRAPTARVWREFWRAIAEDETRLERVKVLVRLHGTGLGQARAVREATYDDGLAEILWRGCVGAVECPDGAIEGLETPPKDGAALWALRDRLDNPDLYTGVLVALLDRADLEAGLAVPLASGSGRRSSRDGDGSPDGIAASVARRD